MPITERSSDTRILQLFAKWADSDDGGAFEWCETAEMVGLSESTLRKYYDAIRSGDIGPKLKRATRDKLITFLNAREEAEDERISRKHAAEIEKGWAERSAKVNTPRQVAKRKAELDASFPTRTADGTAPRTSAEDVALRSSSRGRWALKRCASCCALASSASTTGAR